VALERALDLLGSAHDLAAASVNLDLQRPPLVGGQAVR
jgi:hypothetical protein